MKQFRFLPLAVLLLAFAACDKEEPMSVPILEFSTDKLSADAAGGILSVDVRADVPYEVVMPQETDWVKHTTPAQEVGQPGTPSAVLSFEVGKNTAGSERTAAVIIRSTVGMLADTLDICQNGLADDADITAEFDPGFAAVLQGRDYISNARRITRADVKGITKLNVGNEGLASLKGIEYFTSLTQLLCFDNQLTTLDVSKNTALTALDCSGNPLTALDVSKNTAMTGLSCDGNQLTTLDVSQNTALIGLSCYGNQLTTLDVSKNTALTALDCFENQLTTLDVSQNTALTELSCIRNQLTSLDVSQNTALTKLDCSENQLTSLDVSQNTALTKLLCSINQLTTLDVSQNIALSLLDCHTNQLTSLEVSKNTVLRDLFCYKNPGQDGYFDVTRWPGSTLTAALESWKYDGQTVSVRYIGNE